MPKKRKKPPGAKKVGPSLRFEGPTPEQLAKLEHYFRSGKAVATFPRSNVPLVMDGFKKWIETKGQAFKGTCLPFALGADNESEVTLWVGGLSDLDLAVVMAWLREHEKADVWQLNVFDEPRESVDTIDAQNQT